MWTHLFPNSVRKFQHLICLGCCIQKLRRIQSGSYGPYRPRYKILIFFHSERNFFLWVGSGNSLNNSIHTDFLLRPPTYLHTKFNINSTNFYLCPKKVHCSKLNCNNIQFVTVPIFQLNTSQ